ncbi:phospholipid phosphatase related 3 [Rhinolophus ferrumequinum]|uniref:Phospholipid phosphatase-related protein type 3 n=1 Tax=Rhinolophus ferrumequinum TaxID=59479 RepID=A0A7J7U266_RHIFE|nr:phospholipid phosphatase related 3 [Rhinolophus ferrumequinum]
MISTKEKNKSPKDSMTLLPCFYFVELPIVASSIVSLYFLELTDLFKPAKVGFQCYDRALSMPYVDTSEELIPLLMLLSLAFAAPAASIMVGEGMLYCLQSRLWGRGRGPDGAEGSINAAGCNFNSFLRRTVRFVGVHVFGLCATALVTDIIQLATGYHTPFFLTVCKPNYTLLGTSCEANPYITQDICSGHDTHAILSACKTFPSQHATLSAFAAVYVSMYFNSVISDTTKLLKPSLVFAFAIAAGVCGLTQITQYRSHPVDVYAGFLIGAGIAAYLVIAMSKAPGGPGPKAAETASSSSASSDSSQYRSPSDRDSASIVTIDAHAPHHPVVHLSAGNGPWEWKAAGGGAKGSEGEGGYELGDLARGFRGGPKPPGVSPGSSVSDVDQEEPRFGAMATVNLATGEGLPPLGVADGALGPASRESTLRRKAGGLALGEREMAGHSEAESYYRKMQAARRFKD